MIYIYIYIYCIVYCIVLLCIVYVYTLCVNVCAYRMWDVYDVLVCECECECDCDCEGYIFQREYISWEQWKRAYSVTLIRGTSSVQYDRCPNKNRQSSRKRNNDEQEREREEGTTGTIVLLFDESEREIK